MSTDGVILTKRDFVALVAKNSGIPLEERIKLIRNNPDITIKEAEALIAEIKKKL